MARLPLFAFVAWLSAASLTLAQGETDPTTLPQAALPAEPPAAPPDDGKAADAKDGAKSASADASSAVSGNPAAVNIVSGTGALGRLLGFDKDSGVYIGGAWIGGSNWLMSGGLQPGRWTGDSLTLVDMTLDADKLVGLKGGLFGIEFLQYSGQRTNEAAGVVQGYDSLEGLAPLVRQELYELWWRQELFDKKLIVRIGKSAPTYDFGNVSRAAPTTDVSSNIPSVTGLLYTPIFVNPTMLEIPGYYNSGTGVTATWAPTKNFYLSYGDYDGNTATGEQTGLRGPQFNGHYFYILEAGASWTLGEQKKPGSFGCGIWDQTGPLTAANFTTVHGATGAYLFGSQRLWFRRPGEDNSGISGFYQFSVNNSDTSLARQYWGTGLTGFGLVPCRPKDSLGCGLAWAFLNTDPTAGQFYYPNVASSSPSLRTNELMFQSYYQAYLKQGAYFQPALTYVPNPGERPGIRDAWTLTLRFILLF